MNKLDENELELRKWLVLKYISLRKSKGYSQQDVADRMGVSKQTISRFEKMDCSPTLVFLVQYAKALDTDFESILWVEDQETQEICDVVQQYSAALELLDDYDHQCLKKPEGVQSTYYLSYQECRELIDGMSYGNTSNVFGVEKEQGKLNGILAAIYQNVFGVELYPSIYEKAANLLYFLIKDHPFVDGCKRIGASIFLEFLNKNKALTKNSKIIISNASLVAMTLLVAESKPEEKEVMVKLIMNLFNLPL